MNEYIVKKNNFISEIKFEEILKKNNIKLIKKYNIFSDFYLIKLSKRSSDLEKITEIVSYCKDENVSLCGYSIQPISIDLSSTSDNWGLSRITKKENNFSSYPGVGHYLYNKTGYETDLYIIDTGIDKTNPEFDGRIEDLYDNFNPPGILYGMDDNGHGTAVAGICGSSKYGVAKLVNILNLKCFNSTATGTVSSILAGINAVIAHHNNKIINSIQRSSILNISFNYSFNSMLNEAILSATSVGIVVVCPSGNNYFNLNNSSLDFYPARLDNVISASASDINDNHWINTPSVGENNGSNYGAIVDIYAPGVDIRTTGKFNGSGYPSQLVTGTSFSSAFVSGSIALYLQNKELGRNLEYVEGIKNWLINNASSMNKLNFNLEIQSSGTPNRLLYLSESGVNGSYLKESITIPDFILQNRKSILSDFLKEFPGTRS